MYRAIGSIVAVVSNRTTANTTGTNKKKKGFHWNDKCMELAKYGEGDNAMRSNRARLYIYIYIHIYIANERKSFL